MCQVHGTAGEHAQVDRRQLQRCISASGRALIGAIAGKGRAEGWLRLYWQTAKDNNTAQHLYDKLAQRTDWLRYDLDL